MKIPLNIDREDLIKAANRILLEGIPNGAHSSTYDVFYKNELLPPKLIVSYANMFRNGEELDRNSFEGGVGTECFNLLEKNGFEIYKKDNIYPTLIRFLAQAKTGDLKVSKYPKNIKNLECAVSFGKGNQARIPWISLLKHPNKTSDGVYPVYLLYKDLNLLILAYGVSETVAPELKWDIRHPQTIREYFRTNNLGYPDRYGNSFVFKVYDPNNLPIANEMDEDLDVLVKFYNQITSKLLNPESGTFDIGGFQFLSQKSGLVYSKQLITRFVSSLLTKPFVILTGLSGSGKTKLAQAFVQWISQDEEQYRVVPVGADWTNREPLLGYPNALESGKYVMPDSGALELILHANNHPELPHFLILDEMNLSHVERYFADFLSVMESGDEIPLFAEGNSVNGVPAKLKVPSNLFIIGTVNIDETTNMFSPKVLDRANTIEFRVTQEEMKHFLGNIKPLDMDALAAKGAGMADSFLELASDRTVESNEEIHKALLKFFAELKKTGAEFGYRSASEILRLISNLTVLDNNLSLNAKIDIAIMQKLLPKLHGSRRKLCPVLETLGTFCVSAEVKIIKDVFENSEFDFNGPNVLYPLSLEKIARMYKGAIDNGFASFAEA